ncbi:hypothetical protein Bca52824_000180 [Brassica carinata]|uniref:Uncharacterized protein n=1 Tax=Brassica carinata TaxID=52824 RepID=A0A8X7WGW9_BRACI|nr:hypothetical protein Bca52824_000180 [Brassica carinata]
MQRRKEMNKKFEIYDKQVKAAKRSGNRAQQEKVKDKAKFNAAKEASKSKGKGKAVDEDGPAPEARGSGETTAWSFISRTNRAHLLFCS